ncbi:MAG: flagellar biosynthesis protein FliQ [Chloroflexota bacterium]
MTQGSVLDLANHSLFMAALLAAPMLGFGLIVGLIVSLFQAITQINEVTLTFVPKIIAVVVALILFGPWMLANLLSFTTALFSTLPKLAG